MSDVYEVAVPEVERKLDRLNGNLGSLVDIETALLRIRDQMELMNDYMSAICANMQK